jgi:hypothetical protein
MQDSKTHMRRITVAVVVMVMVEDMVVVVAVAMYIWYRKYPIKYRIS